MTHVGQEPLLGCEQVFQPFEGLVERFDQAADLIVRRTLVGNAPREIVGAV